MGRPEDGIPGRREHSAVLTARTEDHLGAVRPARNHQGQYRNKYPLQQDTSNIERRGPCIRASEKRARGANGYALSAPIRTPCGTQTTSTSMTVDGSCAMRTTHHVLSQGTACLSTPLPKPRWPCLRRP